MRTRRALQEQTALLAQRRLELLAVELASLRDHAAPPAAKAAGADTPPEEPLPDPPPVEPHPTPSRPAASVGRHLGRRRSAGQRVGAWAADRVPPTLRGRVRVGSGAVAVLAVLVAGALALTSWVALQAAGDATVVPASSRAEEHDQVVAAPSADTAPSGAAPTVGASGAAPVVGAAGQPLVAGGTPAEAGEVVVDVAGRVRRPGIVVLPGGARVVDALDAAGGARRGVRLTALNLARLLVDGEQILVGITPPAGVAARAAVPPPGTTGPALLVNINTADQATLEELPGIGPVTAQAILQWRVEQGAFTAVDELLEISGIGEATLTDIAPFVTV